MHIIQLSAQGSSAYENYDNITISFMFIQTISVIAPAFVIGFVVWRLVTAFTRFRIRKKYTAAIEAPSVSVCIPARNEMHALSQCLERILASDYAKMEVIVYNDQSRDDTPSIIRSFAYAGVRFVEGERLPEGWLGKNHAIDTLAREASGTFVLFMDVDTYIKPNTISQLVGYMLSEKMQMISVIPGRSLEFTSSLLLGNLRFFWELVLSHRYRPASSNALWMIRRHTLIDSLDGLNQIKGEVMPELRLAQMLGTHAYHCLLTSQELGVTYEKKLSSQIENSIRLLFPLSGQRWYQSLIFLVTLFILNIPHFGVLYGLTVGWPAHTVVSLILLVLASQMMYAALLHRLWDGRWLVGGLLWPVVVAQEFVLFVVSIWRYATGTVTWKGRPVAGPYVK